MNKLVIDVETGLGQSSYSLTFIDLEVVQEFFYNVVADSDFMMYHPDFVSLAVF